MRVDYGTQGVKEEKIIWKTLASVCEVKYRTGLEPDSRLQITDKAFFVLSSQLDRRYFVGLTLCSTQLRVLVFSRGGSAVSTPVDIHAQPLEFMYILSIFAFGRLSWLGYDENIFVGAGETLFLIFNGHPYQIIHPLFMSCSIQGRGTRVMVIKPTDSPKQYILKDCWLHTDWLTDVDIHRLLQDPAREREEMDERMIQIFGVKDHYHIFKSCMDFVSAEAEWDNKRNLPGIPIYLGHEYVQCTTRQGDTKTEDTIVYLLGEVSTSFEPRRHIRISFHTCAVPITWFSCVREFFNAAMGVLVGMKIYSLLPLDIDTVFRSLQWLEETGSPF